MARKRFLSPSAPKPENHPELVVQTDGKADEGIVKRQPPRSKYWRLIETALRLEPGQYVDVPIPAGEDMRVYQARISRVLSKHVRPNTSGRKFLVRLTLNRRVRVSCR